MKSQISVINNLVGKGLLESTLLNFNEFKRMLLKDSDLDSKRPGIRSILLA